MKPKIIKITGGSFKGLWAFVPNTELTPIIADSFPALIESLERLYPKEDPWQLMW